MERMSAESVFFHRGCLKCDFCECGLRVNNYACDRLPGGEGKMTGSRVEEWSELWWVGVNSCSKQWRIREKKINKVLLEGDVEVVYRNNLEIVNYWSQRKNTNSTRYFTNVWYMYDRVYVIRDFVSLLTIFIKICTHPTLLSFTYGMLISLFVVFSQVLLFSTLQARDEIGSCQEEASLRRWHAQSEYP